MNNKIKQKAKKIARIAAAIEESIPEERNKDKVDDIRETINLIESAIMMLHPLLHVEINCKEIRWH